MPARHLRRVLSAVLLVVALGPTAPAAHADALLPPPGKVYAGPAGANPAGWWKKAAGKHAPVLQQFVVWGSTSEFPKRRTPRR